MRLKDIFNKIEDKIDDRKIVEKANRITFKRVALIVLILIIFSLASCIFIR